MNCLTIDVEDWFHILDSDSVPPQGQWASLESRVEDCLARILDLLDEASATATFFWLGWVAERHKALVRRCIENGHEVASHGYAHVLAHKVGRTRFREDVCRAKALLEDITGHHIAGFRAPGFGVTGATPWAFDVIREAGHVYDSSVFPASRAHGGIAGAELEPSFIETPSGLLLELPMSVIDIFGWRTSVFGGGYLRLAPVPLIKWGIRQLQRAGRPLVIYLHPREIDPDHPRLALSPWRRFKSYVNLKSTLPKLEWLCRDYSFRTMGEVALSCMPSPGQRSLNTCASPALRFVPRQI